MMQGDSCTGRSQAYLEEGFSSHTVVYSVPHNRRQTGGGGGQVRSLASSYARILTLVGEDSALGAPGFSVPAFEDEAEGRPAGAQAGHGQQAAEPVPSTSRDVRPPVRPRVRPTAPRATPRMSRQERHDEAAMQAVANSSLQLQQNEARDARDVEFQGQLLRSIGTLSHRMEAVAESNQEQARATQAVALELQNTTRVLVEVYTRNMFLCATGMWRMLMDKFLRTLGSPYSE
ncbi:hypothetical protein HPB47_023747 [Ixodes persulcatus]|uniref:Uncharacterized protein n=1 Tax=Ixodes persulcatus TaxID=34615 RepID=A0AC60Q674_IXOPE|nr:hypothetical protein HPB47_023747 [Ixodes persulcatus]